MNEALSRHRLSRTRTLKFENLEDRALLDSSSGGLADPLPDLGPQAYDEVGLAPENHHAPNDPSAPEIHLHSDTIPNFARNPSITSSRSGNWFDPSIWSAGRVPRNGDVVQITAGTIVRYTRQSDVRLQALGINPGAKLQFATNVNTKLVVGTLVVFEGGHLEIGNPSDSVNAEVTAELVFANQPLNLQLDPQQFGVGLLGFGKIDLHGSEKDRTWVRLTAEPRAGDSSLLLEQSVTGWNAGDTLFLPDTRQIPADQIFWGTPVYVEDSFTPHWEEVVIDRVEGSRLFLRAPLRFDHLGARSMAGDLELLPHVALLDRNVVVRSENPQGTRGHILFSGRADVNIQYARFRDLGRTDAFRPLDNTRFDEQGNVVHIGTNQIARYAVHFHHTAGPVNPTNEGYQYRFIGNTVDHATKWGVAVHGTSFGLLKDNVAYDIQGAGFVTEDGTELENAFIRNFAGRIQGIPVSSGYEGTLEGDYGRGGAGFWSHRSGNIYRGNVVANALGGGYVITAYYQDKDLPVPLFRGAMPVVEGEGLARRQMPPGEFRDNEAYGATPWGVWIAYPDGRNIFPWDPSFQGVSDIRISDVRIWNTHFSGVRMYYVNGVTLEDVTIFGDSSKVAYHSVYRYANGIDLRNYQNDHLTISRLRIEGMMNGIITPQQDRGGEDGGPPTIVRDSLLANYVNVLVPSSVTWSGPDPTRGKGLELRNVHFNRIAGAVVVRFPDQWDIYMATLQEPTGDIMSLDRVTVYDYQGVKGNNFRVYYPEQHPDFVPPGSNGEFVGSPEPGLTNRQLWNKYGVAVAGILAPCANASCSNALDNDRVSGLAFPLPSVAVVGPGSINAGQGLRITLANADGAESNTQYAFDIDWDGNGQFEQTVGGRPGTQVNHTFATPGRYVVRVRFRHPSGRSDLATHAVQVLPTSNALAVFATTAARVGQQIDLVVAPTGASASQALTADAVGGMAPSLDITNPASAAQNFEYHMDWNGDGRTDELLVGPNGIAAQHVFGTSGVQNVRVLAVSDTGTQVLLQHAISVSPLPPSPSFSLVGPGLSVVGDEVVLAVNAANPLDPAWQTHRLVIDWNGDGIADQAYYAPLATQLRHRYTAPGNYLIRATATDFAGHATSVVQPIAVQAASPATAAAVSLLDAARRAAEAAKTRAPFEAQVADQELDEPGPQAENLIVARLAARRARAAVQNLRAAAEAESSLPTPLDVDAAILDATLTLSEQWLQGPLLVDFE